jgi:outer membrane protein
MKKKILLLLIAVTLLTGSHVFAETMKIGAVDLLRALNESEAGKKAKTDLESLIKTKQSSLDEKGKSIEKLKTELEKQASVLSADAKRSKEEELERMVRDYQRQVADSQNDIKKKEGELTGEILKELRELIQQIGTEEGYTLILEGGDGQILFAKDIDLTESLLKRYNQMKAKPKK